MILITVFFIVTLALAALSGHKQKVSSAASASAVMSVETKAAPAVAPVEKMADSVKKTAEETKNTSANTKK